MALKCPLCHAESPIFFDKTCSCPNCFLIFKSAEIFLSKEEENKRYHYHQNSDNDQGYIDFLNRLVIPLKDFLKGDNHLLDYGCGPSSQIVKMVANCVSETSVFDPLFFPSEELKTQTFDVVTCTEVVEHFQNPNKDWDQLKKLLKPRGILGVMTQFYHDEINYREWWYKNDPTHVVFYREETLNYLAKKYHMKILYNDHRSVIIFQNE